jgi:outer membrane protein assembly factor BamA
MNSKKLVSLPANWLNVISCLPKINKYKLSPLRTLVCFLLFASACSETKYVPADKYLLDKNILKIDNKSIDKSELEIFYRQKPNKVILNKFRFHLGLYNLSKNGSNGWISRTFRKMGEEPSIFDPSLLEKTKQQMGLYLKNKGYYNEKVSDTVLLSNRKASVYYFISPGVPYKINSINYAVKDSSLNKIVMSDTSNCQLKPGSLFDIDNMQSERTRLEYYFKSKGYFNFSKDYIYFEADSILYNHSVNLTLGIRNIQHKGSDSILTFLPHLVYKIGNIKIVIEKDQFSDTIKNRIVNKEDTFLINNIQIIYLDKVGLRPTLLINNIYLTVDQIFNQRDVDETYRSLASLRIFKFINIVFTENTPATTNEIKSLDCRIQLALSDFQSFQAEVEMNHSAGLGTAGSIIYQHKNLFKGAEIFDLKTNAGTEAIGNIGSSELFYTLELGVEAKVQVPKFFLPFRTDQFIRKYNPKTNFAASYNFLHRPEFTQAVANLSFGYSWKGNKYTNFTVNPVDVNYVRLLNYKESFKQWIDTTFLGNIYNNHFVPVSSISFTYNNQQSNKNVIFWYFRTNLESAGNTTKLLSQALNAKKDDNGEYQLFGISFAQYVKGDIDCRYYIPVNTTDKVVFRFFGGMAYPYSNSKTIPFEKQYYSGGANSIRAWEVRKLGPGSYKDTISKYPNSNADIKLEANVEYRFKLFWVLEGALFIDAGNIWAVNKNDKREGALFQFNSFYNQIAIGTGFGTRFNFSYFLVRLDLGFKLRDPSEKINQRWAFGKSIDIGYFNPNIGIGYPF